MCAFTARDLPYFPRFETLSSFVTFTFMEHQDQNLPGLSRATEDRLQELGVAVIYAFGSRATGRHLAFSDFDIGVVMKDVSELQDQLPKCYPELYDILSSDVPDSPFGPKLDISFLQRANPALGMKAIIEGRILFESSAMARADFEELMFVRYNDYRKLQREFEEATLLAFASPT